MTERVRHIIGCMTGTSLDGLDAVLTRIVGEGLDMRAEFVAMTSAPLGDLADVLRSMANGEAHPPIDYMRAARRLGELHAQACAELAASAESKAALRRGSPHPRPLPEGEGAGVDLVVAHGQTIWHAPGDEAGHLSWQLFDPWPIVRRLGLPVCYDLRQADLIAGGEGAPVTPLADWVMYRQVAATTAVINLGGIANATRLPRGGHLGEIVGGDVCPCNILIDGMVHRRLGLRLDRDGAVAAQGSHSGAIYAEVGRAPLKSRSGGREQFSERWLGRVDEAVSDFGDADAISAAVEAVAMWIADWCHEAEPAAVILAGGGVRNGTLVERIRARCEVDVQLSDDLGIPCEAREAMGFAVLGALSQDGVAITLPAVTGSRNAGRAGAWVYP